MGYRRRVSVQFASNLRAPYSQHASLRRVRDTGLGKHRHASRSTAFTPGVLAPVRVLLSRSILAYSTPSAPLASTWRFRCLATYTRCPRCAFLPRRLTSGSVLSLTILSRHVVLYDHEESGGCMYPVPSPPTLAFVTSVTTRHSHRPHKSVSCGHSFRGFTPVRLRYDLSSCSPS